ncbi:uncharacterized protein FA14DRAFT_140239 [Meira miltonrushii]|uniref:Serine/threonine-protein kinase RIO2 n=1 Tax=Meira miltonrushii TaxID=1280837 RepID=A0A316V0Y2_9BASI|nr:uncharacterized protein FA14DRAFT_140239 [Meira miltonrushii]PWN31210.1 hypothetical protein FA14DRAFT_140239 [Meira miltonrushii]
MRLDATDLRYLSSEEFKVLKATETGSLSHEVVPSTLIASTSGLHHAGLNKIMSELSRRGLIARERNIKYDGWRLTYGGYDWLAIRAMREKDALLGVGTRVGVGKESDVYMAHRPGATAEDVPIPAVLKVHRLGRISFRKIKEKRDYLGNRKSAPNWMYLSRLAAKKEWQFMQILHKNGFPVPEPIYQSRHSILMSRINGYPLRQIVELPIEQVESLFASLIAIIVRLARAGLIHCDFNEFNIMVREAKQEGDEEEELEEDENSIWSRAKASLAESPEDDGEYKLKPGERIEKCNGFDRIYFDPNLVEQDKREQASEEEEESESDGSSEGEEEEEEAEEFDQEGTNEALRVTLKDGSSIEPILIDFPQMISVEHANAEYYFDRDVEGVKQFFRKRFRFQSDRVPKFRDIVPEDRQKQREIQLDVQAQASGLGSLEKEETPLDQYMTALRLRDETEEDEDEEEGSEEEGEEEDEQEEEKEAEVSDEDINSRLQGGTLLPPSMVEPTGRGLARQSRRRRGGGMPVVARKLKGEDEEDQRDPMEIRIAAEKQRRARQDAKHHGKKAASGKAGRAWAAGAGSKAKTSDKALLDNSMQF